LTKIDFMLLVNTFKTQIKIKRPKTRCSCRRICMEYKTKRYSICATGFDAWVLHLSSPTGFEKLNFLRLRKFSSPM